MADKKKEKPKGGGVPKAPPPKKNSKEEVKIPSRDERAAILMETINKKARGRAVLMPASEYVLPYLTKRLPTGLLTLDVALRGGFPAGGISQVAGKRNAGKSWISWQVIRQLQHMLGDRMKVLLAMTEIPADRDQARKAGVRISMGQYYIDETNRAKANAGYPPLTPEEVEELMDQVGTIDELHAFAAEDFYDVILRAIESNVYHLIVIDSIGNIMSAAAEENESVHDKTYAGAAGPNTQFLQHMTNLLTMKDEWGQVRDTCLIGINQIRDDMKNPEKKKTPGGHALEHAKLVDIWVESGSQLGSEEKVLKMTNEGLKQGQQFVAYGKQVNWKIEKGKAGMHEGERGQYVYDFRIGNADFFTDTIIAGLTYGIIEGNGAWYNIPDPSNPGVNLIRVNGRDNLIQALARDSQEKAAAGDPKTLMNYIRSEAFRRNNININYEWVDQ